MNIKKAIVWGLIGTVPFIIVGAIYSQLPFALFPYLKTGISGTIPPTKMAITMIWMGIIECISFAIIFGVFYEGILQKDIHKGPIYGFVLWYINIFLSFVGSYAFGFILTMPDIIFVNILKFFMLPAYGATLGWTYEKLKI